MVSYLVWPLFVLLPGAAAVVLVRPAMVRRPVLLVAVSPAITFAVSIVVATLLGAIGVGPLPGVPVVAVVLVLGGTARMLVLHQHHRTDHREPDASHELLGQPDGTEPMERRLAPWLLVGGIVLCAVTWFAPGAPSVPLNRDVQNHAYFVARIVDQNTVDPAVVQSRSPTDPAVGASYYPLASHVTVATARAATDQPIAELLMAWAVMATIIVLPCGLYELSRRIVPRRPLVAGFAALCVPLLAIFPYQPFVWGGLAFVTTMSVVPGVLALALDAVDRRDTLLLAITSVAILGVALAHTSELVLLAIILGAFAGWDVIGGARIDRNERRSALLAWATLAGMCALLLAPTVLTMLAATGERSRIAETLDLSIPELVHRLIAFDVDEGPPQPVMGVLALVGGVIVLADRRRRPLGLFAPLMTAIAVLVLLVACTTMTGLPWEPMRDLTIPWYRSYWRLLYNVALFAPLFIGVTLAAISEVATRHPRKNPALAVWGTAACIVVMAFPTTTSTLLATGVRGHPFSDAELTLFENLARSSTDGTESSSRAPTVLNQENDGSVWAYIVAGVPTASGMQPFDDDERAARDASMIEDLADATNNSAIQRLLEERGVRLVLVGEGTYSGERPQMTPDLLRKAEGFRVIDHKGRFWVFAVPEPTRNHTGPARGTSD